MKIYKSIENLFKFVFSNILFSICLLFISNIFMFDAFFSSWKILSIVILICLSFVPIMLLPSFLYLGFIIPLIGLLINSTYSSLGVMVNYIISYTVFISIYSFITKDIFIKDIGKNNVNIISLFFTTVITSLAYMFKNNGIFYYVDNFIFIMQENYKYFIENFIIKIFNFYFINTFLLFTFKIILSFLIIVSCAFICIFILLQRGDEGAFSQPTEPGKGFSVDNKKLQKRTWFTLIILTLSIISFNIVFKL